MKCLQRYCCLLCALVLLSTVFSINAHAKDLTLGSYVIEHSATLYKQGSGKIDSYSAHVNPSNQNKDFLEVADGSTLYSNAFYTIDTSYEFIPDKSPLFVKGGNSIVTMFEGYYGVGLKNASTGGFAYFRGVNNTRVLVTYADDTSEYFDDVDYTLTGSKITMSFEFVPEKDVKSLKFFAMQDINMTNTPNHLVTYYLGEGGGIDAGFSLSVNQETEEVGQLKGILGKIKEFKDEVGNKFTNLIQGITELPGKLWNVISDGLKNLFVPDEDFIVQYKEDMDTMLSDKLGAVYQVIDITLESWDRISASDEQNTINLPQTTINLPENNKFSFGGYDVKIVPDGFDVLANAIKLIGGICVTILFVNGLRRRYDEIMGVEK